MNTIQILNQTSTLNVTGEAFKASGYYGGPTNYTVFWSLTNFVGRIYIEASLATSPTDTDWFPVFTQEYFQYPVNPMAPTGTIGDSDNVAKVFSGNYLWIRARVDRSYITPIPDVNNVGAVEKILITYY